jgi:hypothetical protein
MRQATLWDAAKAAVEGGQYMSYIPNDVCENRHRSEPHSQAAHEKVLPHKSEQLNHVLRAIRTLGKASCEDVEQLLSMSHQSASARMADAKRLNFIEKVGTIKTASGCSAGLYRIRE